MLQDFFCRNIITALVLKCRVSCLLVVLWILRSVFHMIAWLVDSGVCMKCFQLMLNPVETTGFLFRLLESIIMTSVCHFKALSGSQSAVYLMNFRLIMKVVGEEKWCLPSIRETWWWLLFSRCKKILLLHSCLTAFQRSLNEELDHIPEDDDDRMLVRK